MSKNVSCGPAVSCSGFACLIKSHKYHGDQPYVLLHTLVCRIYTLYYLWPLFGVQFPQSFRLCNHYSKALTIQGANNESIVKEIRYVTLGDDVEMYSVHSPSNGVPGGQATIPLSLVTSDWSMISTFIEHV